MTSLKEALKEISSNQLHSADLLNSFDKIAEILLRHTKIVTPNVNYYLREIEFYFYDKEKHPDPYTHKNPRQELFGDWYFHRFRTIENFEKSNRNGVDITFGNKDTKRFGGILIRKIKNAETGNFIVGINRVARELIKNVGVEKIEKIALDSGEKAFDKEQLLHLESGCDNCSAPIFKTQRNGLIFKEDSLYKDYYKRAYCYYNHDLNVTEIIQVRPAI